MSLFQPAGSEPIRVIVAGRDLHCLICGDDLFWEREAQLNTAVATFFKFDWANTSGKCHVCANCGYIHWFLSK
jgi:hypothetical protein